MSDNLTIGGRIADLRKKKGFTQDALAKATGKTRSAIAQIEANSMKPDWEFLRDLVRICDSTYSYIFGDIPDEKSSSESKNEMHIKKTDLGVRIEAEKGGQDRGQVMGIFPNEMHIKSAEFKLSDEEAQAIRQISSKRIQDKIRKDYGEFGISAEKLVNEPARQFYGDLRAMIKQSIDTNQKVLVALLMRLEHLEDQIKLNQPDPDDAVLPGGK